MRTCNCPMHVVTCIRTILINAVKAHCKFLSICLFDTCLNFYHHRTTSKFLVVWWILISVVINRLERESLYTKIEIGVVLRYKYKTMFVHIHIIIMLEYYTTVVVTNAVIWLVRAVFLTYLEALI